MNSNYWKKYYNSSLHIDLNGGHQKNVGRTRNGKIVTEKDWMKTLSYITEKIELESSDSILELCCGNGLILGELAKYCHSATGVDFSSMLINQFKSKYDNKNINLIVDDVKDVSFKDSTFNKCVIYFSIQHFSNKETLKLIEKCLKWLKPNGSLFIGDVPDLEKKWDYINQPSYQKDYFNRLKDDKPKIGNWYHRKFFLALPSYLQDIKVSVLDQPAYQINSDYRFDVLINSI